MSKVEMAMAEPTEETRRMVEASKQQIDAYVEALLKDSEVRAALYVEQRPRAQEGDQKSPSRKVA